MTNTEQKWLREIRDNTKQLERIAKRLDAIHRQLDRFDRKDEPQSKSQYNFGEYVDRLWKIAYERGKREALEQTELSCDTCKLKDTTEWCKRQEVCRAYKPKDKLQNDCSGCRHYTDGMISETVCNDCKRSYTDNYEPQTIYYPQVDGITPSVIVKDEPQTCSVSGRPYTDCCNCEYFKCIADEPQTYGYMTTEQTTDYRKMLDNVQHEVYGNIFEDEPQIIIGERFPSYITENNAQVLDGWQANPRTSTTAVENES